MSRTIIFPDTNIFLHYPPIDQIDWCAVCGTDEVQIVLCMPVLHQLDEKKDDPRRKERARRAITDIARIRGSGRQVRNNVTLEFMVKELRNEEFPTGFSPSSADDAIILLFQEYRRDHASDSARIVTEDLGMQVKCELHGVDIIALEKTLRLPDQLDETKRKLNEAEKTLAQLRARLPILELGLTTSDKSEPIGHLNIQFSAAPTPIDIESEMAGFRKQFPIRNVELPARLPEAPRLSLDDFSGRVVTGISPDEIARYNREVERFLEAYPRFLKDLNTYREIKSRAFSFDVWLLNSGSCPAEEIGIHLHFPDGFDVFDAGHGPREPHKPAFPRQPQTFAERFQEMNFLTNLGSMSRMPSIPSATPKANSPQIRKTNSYDVDHEWPSLKHGYQARVISLEIVFTSFDMIKSFNVPYQISAANHPDTQKGELHFIVPNTTEVAGK